MVGDLALMCKTREKPTVTTCHKKLDTLPNGAIAIVTSADPIHFHRRFPLAVMVTTGTLRVDDCRRRTAPSVSKHLLAVLIKFELKLAFCVFVGRDNSRGWENDGRGWWIRHGGSCEMKRRFHVLDTAVGRSDSRSWDVDSRGW
jgi:hypothetical protein